MKFKLKFRIFQIILSHLVGRKIINNNCHEKSDYLYFHPFNWYVYFLTQLRPSIKLYLLLFFFLPFSLSLSLSCFHIYFRSYRFLKFKLSPCQFFIVYFIFYKYSVIKIKFRFIGFVTWALGDISDAMLTYTSDNFNVFE